MRREVFRCLRHAAPAEKGGRRAENAPVVGEFARLQAAVFQRGVAQRQVEAALDQIERRVGQPQIEVEPRVALQEFRQQRGDIELGEGAGGGEAQRAGRVRTLQAQRAARRVFLRQDFRGIGEKLRPVRG